MEKRKATSDFREENPQTSGTVIFVGDTAVKAFRVTVNFHCPGSQNDLEGSSPTTTLHEHSASPPQSRSATFAGRNDRSIKRKGREWRKKNATPLPAFFFFFE